MNTLEAHYLSRRMRERIVLDRLDFQISRGEVVAVCGANGAGKTTLLRCLAGQLRPNSGDVLWFGESPRRSHATNRLVGFASHESCLYVDLTVGENLLFAARMLGLPQAAEHTNTVLRATGLDRCASQRAGELSKGMRQRVSIVRALIHDPPIVILDEPFSGIDVSGRQWLEDWIIELRARDRAICFTSHDERQCRRVADRRFELRAGKLVQDVQCISAI
jgi:heme ABC exporter ATP-binding subunit CcmA